MNIDGLKFYDKLDNKIKRVANIQFELNEDVVNVPTTVLSWSNSISNVDDIKLIKRLGIKDEFGEELYMYDIVSIDTEIQDEDMVYTEVGIIVPDDTGFTVQYLHIDFKEEFVYELFTGDTSKVKRLASIYDSFINLEKLSEAIGEEVNTDYIREILNRYNIFG